MQCQICGLGVSDKKEVQYRYHVHCLIQQAEDIRSESLIAKTTAEKRAGKAERQVLDMQQKLAQAKVQIQGLIRQLAEAQAPAQAQAALVGQFTGLRERVQAARATLYPSPSGTAASTAKCKICTHQESSHLSGICAVCNRDCSKPPEPEKKVDRFSLIDLD